MVEKRIQKIIDVIDAFGRLEPAPNPHQWYAFCGALSLNLASYTQPNRLENPFGPITEASILMRDYIYHWKQNGYS